MKQKDVIVGGLYRATVSNHSVIVRVDSLHRWGGYNVTNLRTDRQLHFRSSQRLTDVGKNTPKPSPKPVAEPTNAELDAAWEAVVAADAAGDHDLARSIAADIVAKCDAAKAS